MKHKFLKAMISSQIVFLSTIYLISCSNSSEKNLDNEEVKQYLKQKIIGLKNNQFLKKEVQNSDIGKIEHHLKLIEDSSVYLKTILSKLNIRFNQQYFHKFAKDFEDEKQFILKPFKNNDNQNELMQSEMLKLRKHSLTMINYLESSYNSLLNKNIFNPLDDWQQVKFDEENYNYYKDLLNKKGEDLVSSLKKIISKTMNPGDEVTEESDVKKNYDNLWNLFKLEGFKDLERDKEKYILDIYSKNPLGKDMFNFTENNQAKKLEKGDKRFLGSEYQREHLLPQSSFKHKNKNSSDENKSILVQASPMYFDAHHIFPVDGVTNRIRSNNTHGIVVDPIINEKTKMANDSKIGWNENKEKVFEPIDAFKGDISRSYLYFAIRYNDRVEKFNENTVFTKKFPYVNDKQLKLMLDWHENIDLVDLYDIRRNNEIFKYQNNRNPFIDIPYLSKWIWNENYRNQPLVFLKA